MNKNIELQADKTTESIRDFMQNKKNAWLADKMGLTVSSISKFKNKRTLFLSCVSYQNGKKLMSDFYICSMSDRTPDLMRKLLNGFNPKYIQDTTGISNYGLNAFMTGKTTRFNSKYNKKMNDFIDNERDKIRYFV